MCTYSYFYCVISSSPVAGDTVGGINRQRVSAGKQVLLYQPYWASPPHLEFCVNAQALEFSSPKMFGNNGTYVSINKADSSAEPCLLESRTGLSMPVILLGVPNLLISFWRWVLLYSIYKPMCRCYSAVCLS